MARRPLAARIRFTAEGAVSMLVFRSGSEALGRDTVWRGGLMIPGR
jgi:hypothetical protein